ncbi:MAG: hypothetical protein VKK04_04550 [Synechococcales bacterium]|nr:hypothetical protein [Synechococcales bacterium]
MVYIPSFLASGGDTPQADSPVLLPTPQAAPDEEIVRHILLGSPAAVRRTIHLLHVLNYGEPGLWSRLITVPPGGIVLTPQQGETMSYLIRRR